MDKSGTGWHFLDDVIKLNNIDGEVERIFDGAENVLNAILVGGKYNIKDTEFSKPLFRALTGRLKNKVPALTVFEEHKKFAYQTHLNYDRETDTLTMCCVDVPKYQQEFHKCVTSLRGLSKFYKRFFISDADTLYINGKKISRDKYPKNVKI